MKYLAKLHVPGVPESTAYPLDVEAETPLEAVHAARDYWQKNRDGPRPLPAGAAIYVYDGGTVLHSVLDVTLDIQQEK